MAIDYCYFFYNDTRTDIKFTKMATLSCAGKKAESDITILCRSEVNITYNGTTIEIKNASEVVLNCAGKVFASDIIIATPNEILDTFLICRGAIYNGIKNSDIYVKVGSPPNAHDDYDFSTKDVGLYVHLPVDKVYLWSDDGACLFSINDKDGDQKSGGFLKRTYDKSLNYEMSAGDILNIIPSRVTNL